MRSPPGTSPTPLWPAVSRRMTRLRVKNGACAPLRFSSMLSRPATGMTSMSVMSGAPFLLAASFGAMNLPQPRGLQRRTVRCFTERKRTVPRNAVPQNSCSPGRSGMLARNGVRPCAKRDRAPPSSHQPPEENPMPIRLHELHPTLVHAPLGLLPVAAGLDLACAFNYDRFLDRSARMLWGLGTAGGLLAGTTGLAASQEVKITDDHV